MTERREVIDFCLTFPQAYEDYPFDDFNWTVMRRRDTRRGFAWIFEKDEKLWCNVKAEPERGFFWRGLYEAVLPAYHMNKEHWISLILDGSIPVEDIRTMIADSYELCGAGKRKSTRKTSE